MKKANLNFLIDGIMFLLMGLLTGIGFLIKYVLLNGEDRWIKYGKNVDISYLGLDRHGWGKIHLIVALVLIAFLLLHIILHWNLTVCMFKGLFKNKGIRGPILIVFTIITVILTVFPFLISPEVNNLAPGKERFKIYAAHINADSLIEIRNSKHIESQNIVNLEKKHINEHRHIDSTIEVKGFMTLQEVSNKYDVSCDLIKEKLEIPKSVTNNSKLGFLRKQYNFKMSDVELIIFNHKN